ncbi:MAG: hypothetical protein HDS48_00710 [Bacteroides sp.]|nr:hypothetical protein [Bacteroides sp.]
MIDKTMNEIVKTQNTSQNTVESTPQFKGYTLEDLRYQRALISLKKDFSQAKMLRSMDSLRSANPFSLKNKNGSVTSKYGSLASKVISGLGYLDYAKMGFSLFNSGRKIYSFFRKKK